ncbi:MAG: exo-alpha-sialidase [Nitrososphaerota archaeon]|nr:exo-alpha-sialidase [Nitrososphaerota archaeon]MDG6960266.1 exo-alpha-sialidase [Nitrososphaerota archaeon]MDG6973532.1 exo-alpha-sialidase [Nitrososphaerota archaeon]MDG7014963.1 exo-alpha-sialidase [Nitrososphaerota archaeon]WGO50920.1 MAG: exo-alpha-sialidase [Nitrososphaerota archaeon]
MKQDRVSLMVGTRKGAFVFSSDSGRREWKSSGPYFKGEEVYNMAYDRRSETYLASVISGHWGPTIATRKGEGGEWKISKTPPKFPKSSGLSVARVWQIRPGTEDQPGVVYAGVEPACLFRSDDWGKTWKVNEAMMNHKTRKKWQPGNGGLCLHTVLVNEKRPKRIIIAISAVGTMKSEDDGETWKFKNKDVLQDFAPNKYPEYGQCVHKLAIHPGHPDVIFHQNHCGVYRSDDAGENWKDIRNNLPSRFGFPAAVDANEPRRFYAAPLEGDFARIPLAGHFAVWATDNAGKEWAPLDSGLPNVSYFTVLRDAMVNDQEDPCGLYFGTTTGQLFASSDQGNHWTKITDGLPPVLSVSASAV